MRENYCISWTMRLQSSIRLVVKEKYPEEIRNWPLLAGIRFEGYNIEDRYCVLVLRENIQAIFVGDGNTKTFPFDDYISLPTNTSNIMLWMQYLIDKFKLEPEEAAFIFSLEESNQDKINQEIRALCKDELKLIDHQLYFAINRYKNYLDEMNKKKNKSQQEIRYTVSGDGNTIITGDNFGTVNVKNINNDNVFDILKELTKQIDNESSRQKVINSISKMEAAKDSSDFITKYREFMSVVADHISIFAPALPVLAQLL